MSGTAEEISASIVHLGSSDVHELATLDDIDQYLSRARDNLREAKEDVFQTILAEYDQFAKVFHCAHDIRSKVLFPS